MFRWIREDLSVHRNFVGLYFTDSITSAALVFIVEDTMFQLNIKLDHCCGQCYGGASAMSVAKLEVATVITCNHHL